MNVFGSNVFASHTFDSYVLAGEKAPVPVPVGAAYAAGGAGIWPLWRTRQERLREKIDLFVKGALRDLSSIKKRMPYDPLEKLTKSEAVLEREKYQQTIANLRKRLEELEALQGELQKEKETNSDLRSQLRRLNKLRRSLMQEITLLEERVKHLETYTRALEGQIQKLKERVQELEQEKNILNRQFKETILTKAEWSPLAEATWFGLGGATLIAATYHLVPRRMKSLKALGYTAGGVLLSVAFLKGLAFFRAIGEAEVPEDQGSYRVPAGTRI